MHIIALSPEKYVSKISKFSVFALLVNLYRYDLLSFDYQECKWIPIVCISYHCKRNCYTIVIALF